MVLEAFAAVLTMTLTFCNAAICGDIERCQSSSEVNFDTRVGRKYREHRIITSSRQTVREPTSDCHHARPAVQDRSSRWILRRTDDRVERMRFMNVKLESEFWTRSGCSISIDCKCTLTICLYLRINVLTGQGLHAKRVARCMVLQLADSVQAPLGYGVSAALRKLAPPLSQYTSSPSKPHL